MKIPLLTETHIDYHVAFLPQFNSDCRRLSAAVGEASSSARKSRFLGLKNDYIFLSLN